MGGGARALVRQSKTAGFFCKNRRNQAALKVLIKNYMALWKWTMQAKLALVL